MDAQSPCKWNKDRKARREAEISGLKEALSILNSEAAFLQRRHRMRGANLAVLTCWFPKVCHIFRHQHLSRISL